MLVATSGNELENLYIMNHNTLANNNKDRSGAAGWVLRFPRAKGFFFFTSCGNFLDLRLALDRARRVRHNKGVYGERSEPRSVSKKKT